MDPTRTVLSQHDEQYGSVSRFAIELSPFESGVSA